MAVYFTLLKPGDTVLGPNLSHGGHLTAGSPMNFSGKLYQIVAVRRPARTPSGSTSIRSATWREQHRPKLIIAGGSAFPRAIDFKPFREIADEVGAALMADIAHPAGLVAAGLHPSPVPYADFVTTTTHKTLRGPRGGMVMCRAAHAQALDKTVMPGMQGGPLMHVIAAKAVAFREALTPEWRAYQRQIVRERARAGRGAAGARLPAGLGRHRHPPDAGGPHAHGASPARTPRRRWTGPGSPSTRTRIPFETKGPMVTSGIRLGTPAVTTRGMKEPEMARIARAHRPRALEARATTSVEAAVRSEVQELTRPLPR